MLEHVLMIHANKMSVFDSKGINDDDVELEHVMMINANDNRSIHAQMIIEGTRVNFQLDTGATVNSMSTDTYTAVTSYYKLTKLKKSSK